MRFSFLDGLSALGLLVPAVAASSSSSSGLVEQTWNGIKYGCRCYHGDDCWPGVGDWASLNKTVGGNLLVNVPPGAVCHDHFRGPLGNISTYDAAACADATAHWGSEQWTYVLKQGSLD